jgi:hypothetical protein
MPPEPMPCMICAEPITPETDTGEHVIPNAIGGRLKVRDFVHLQCNSDAGSSWDAAFAEQMHPLCLIFGVDRQRCETKPLEIETTAGEKFTLRPDGSLRLADPKFSKTQTQQGTAINFAARDWVEARAMLTGLKKKHPHIDVEALLAQAEEATAFPKGLIKHQFAFPGPDGGRSMVKTAAAFARHLGVPTTACDLAAAYLRGAKVRAPFGPYFVSDLIENRPVGVPLHCVAVRGDPGTGLLLAYVEYFGGIRSVVCLTESYAGPAVEGAHVIDPTTGTTLDLRVALGFDRAELEAIYKYGRGPKQGQKHAMDAVLAPVMARHQEVGRQRAFAEAAEYAFAHCGAEKGARLTTEQEKKVWEIFWQRLEPYLNRPMIVAPVQA